MLVIRLKSNPLIIKSFGRCKVTPKQPKPLGEFDEELFEQVVYYGIRNKQLDVFRNKFYTEKGSVDFDADAEEEVELNELPEGWEQYQEKPILSGKDVEKFLRDAFKNQPRSLRKTALMQISIDLNLLQFTDELTITEFQEAADDIKQALAGVIPQETIDGIEAALLTYISENFKYADE